MSALPEFVLQEALWEELEDGDGQSSVKEEGFSFEWIGEEKLLFEEKETLADRRGEEARSDDGREKEARRKREGPPTGRIFFAAALFLLGGLCLEYFRLYHPSLEAAQLPAKGVALAMLLFSALLSLAAVGLLFLGERHRQKDEEQELTETDDTAAQTQEVQTAKEAEEETTKTEQTPQTEENEQKED